MLGDQEASGMCNGGNIALAPVGGHVGSWGGSNNVTLDGKPLGPQVAGHGQVYQMQFTPDGNTMNSFSALTVQTRFTSTA